MKIISFSILLLTTTVAFGQNVVNVEKNPTSSTISNRMFYTVGGMPFSTAKYVRITGGSPYFSETWMRSKILINDSSEYDNVRLRLDLLDNSLVYLNQHNEEMTSPISVVEISMIDTTTGNRYLFVHSSAIPGAPANEKVYYQALGGKDFILFKHHFKDIYESKPYGSSVTEQTIRTNERYFIATGNTFTRVKKLSEIADLAGSKRQELYQYIDKNKLSNKKEADFIALIDHYASLK